MLARLSRGGFSHAIKALRAREVFDSRGWPTVEAELTTELGTFRAIAPSGASTGIFEALELRDGDPRRMLGKGVLRAVENVNGVIAPALLGKSVLEQAELDRLMVEKLDGSRSEYGWNKHKLGANAVLPVSLALARAGAAAKGLELYAYLAALARRPATYRLPVPCFNIINGGKHAGNRLAFQEFMALPLGATSFREAMEMGVETYQRLRQLVGKRYGAQSTNVGDEGGFAPDISEPEEALDIALQAVEAAGLRGKVFFALDVAASEMFDEKCNCYNLDFKAKAAAPRLLTGAQLLAVYERLVEKYPIVSIEDPFDQQDFEHWRAIRARLGDRVPIVGDDLLVTNVSRIELARAQGLCNSLLLKVNQIGSLSESIAAAALAKSYQWGVMISHRSGETEDTFIADLAVGLSTGQIKTGAPCRSERVAKHNQLLRIEERLGRDAEYAGPRFKDPPA